MAVEKDTVSRQPGKVVSWVATRCMRHLVGMMFHKDESTQTYYAKSTVYSYQEMDKIMREALNIEVGSGPK